MPRAWAVGARPGPFRQKEKRPEGRLEVNDFARAAVNDDMGVDVVHDEVMGKEFDKVERKLVGDELTDESPYVFAGCHAIQSADFKVSVSRYTGYLSLIGYKGLVAIIVHDDMSLSVRHEFEIFDCGSHCV